MWLECPVEETDQRGRRRRTTEARDSRRGIPQGSPLSPLLANLYMRRFVLGWKKLGLEQSFGTRLVTYADDLVILCRRGSAAKALHHLREIMGKLRLTVNEEKTRICRVPDGEFDFLGYTFGRMGRPCAIPCGGRQRCRHSALPPAVAAPGRIRRRPRPSRTRSRARRRWFSQRARRAGRSADQPHCDARAVPGPCPPHRHPSVVSSRLYPQQGLRRGDGWSRPWLGLAPGFEDRLS